MSDISGFASATAVISGHSSDARGERMLVLLSSLNLIAPLLRGLLIPATTPYQ